MSICDEFQNSKCTIFSIGHIGEHKVISVE